MHHRRFLVDVMHEKRITSASRESLLPSPAAPALLEFVSLGQRFFLNGEKNPPYLLQRTSTHYRYVARPTRNGNGHNIEFQTAGHFAGKCNDCVETDRAQQRNKPLISLEISGPAWGTISKSALISLGFVQHPPVSSSTAPCRPASSRNFACAPPEYCQAFICQMRRTGLDESRYTP